VILATLSGQMSVNDACAELGVGPTQFANLRARMLQGAVDAMEPQSIGRPRIELPKSSVDLLDLEQEIFDLEHENIMLQAKLEVNAALQAARMSKSTKANKPPPKGPRSTRRGIS